MSKWCFSLNSTILGGIKKKPFKPTEKYNVNRSLKAGNIASKISWPLTSSLGCQAFSISCHCPPMMKHVISTHHLFSGTEDKKVCEKNRHG